MELPPKILKMLKCVHCGNPLSIFPIKLYENGGQVCGRCEVQSSDARQMLAYESVAGLATFPCQNQKLGCTFTTTPDQMVNHEETCSYKEYDCFENCKWRGMFKNIKSHYQDMHKDLVKTTDEYFKHEGKDCKVLVVNGEDVFLFQFKTRSTGFTAEVYLLHGRLTSDLYLFELHFRLVSNFVVKLEALKVKSICEFPVKEGTLVEGIDLNKSDSFKLQIVLVNSSSILSPFRR